MLREGLAELPPARRSIHSPMVLDLSQRGAGLIWLFGNDVNDVEWVRKFVSNFHLPIQAGPQFAIKALEHPTRSNGRLAPCGMPVRQFFADRIEVGSFVVNVEIIPWHRR